MKKITFLFCLLGLSLLVQSGFSQNVGINDNGASPHASAILDVQSTDKGFLVPQMTSVQRNNISNPAHGLIVFDLSDAHFWFYDATWSSWTRIERGNVVADTDDDTKIHVEKIPDEDQIRFDIKGTERLRLDSRTLHLSANGNSVFIGNNAGTNDDGNNNENTFLGVEAGRFNTSGGGNTFIGRAAGRDNVDGEQNAALGNYAGTNLSSGFLQYFDGLPGR